MRYYIKITGPLFAVLYKNAYFRLFLNNWEVCCKDGDSGNEAKYKVKIGINWEYLMHK